MQIDVLTLFPDLFSFMRTYGVIGRAIQAGRFTLETHQIRDYATDKHHIVDDQVVGGAAGMLMKPEPLKRAIVDVKGVDGHVVYLSPQGPLLTQDRARALAKMPHLVLLCGHYEGIDQRITDHYVDEEISIGDYVLTGGELPAMVLIDTIVRWVDGVLGNPDSASTDSHAAGLLQYDEYTKPRVFEEWEVPEILYSGNHQAIAKWRLENAIEKTKERRPDLYARWVENRHNKEEHHGLH